MSIFGFTKDLRVFMKMSINNIFIYLPNWLGDAVMSSAAIKIIKDNYPKAKITFYGNKISCDIFSGYDDCEFIYEDKKHRFKQFLKLPKYDLAISFKGSFSAKMCFFVLKSKKKLFFNKKTQGHQVEKYANLISSVCEFTKDDLKLFIPFTKKQSDEKLFGINAGAKYGSAKRWEAKYFADVAKEYAKTHKIIIFGVDSEKDICDEIKQTLIDNDIKCENLCGKTTIKSLCEYISSLDLFITNDSGPMHIAAAYDIKTVAIFGPTKDNETSPYSKNAKIVKLNLDCMPCMKRSCPLNHHKCMKDLKPQIVINALNTFNQTNEI